MRQILPNAIVRTLKIVAVVAFLILLISVIVGGAVNLNTAQTAKTTREQEWLKGEGAFFVKKTCVSCHSISSLGIKAASIGPDLSDAVADTPRRFGKSLEEFLDKPSGTMSIVLSTQIPLTNAEKHEAIRLLKVAYQRKLEAQSQAK